MPVEGYWYEGIWFQISCIHCILIKKKGDASARECVLGLLLVMVMSRFARLN